jgi:hypothetical protein
LRLPLLLTVCLTGTAAADVTSSAAGGFTVEHEHIVAADREVAYTAAVKQVSSWWNSDHTITGDASRLSLDPRVMGCFCETLDDGAVAHLVVTFVNRNVILRLSGGLGPLGLMGVAGNMTWEFFDTDSGGTRIKWTYAVGGFREGGLDSMAAPVDAVLGDALSRLGRFIETGHAVRTSARDDDG